MKLATYALVGGAAGLAGAAIRITLTRAVELRAEARRIFDIQQSHPDIKPGDTYSWDDGPDDETVVVCSEPRLTWVVDYDVYYRDEPLPSHTVTDITSAELLATAHKVNP